MRGPTYDIWYIGTLVPQRLTDWYGSEDRCRGEIPGIINHTESEINDNVDDPHNYVVYQNGTRRFWEAFDRTVPEWGKRTLQHILGAPTQLIKGFR